MSSSAKSPTKEIRILIADDHPVVREGLMTILALQGCRENAPRGFSKLVAQKTGSTDEEQSGLRKRIAALAPAILPKEVGFLALRAVSSYAQMALNTYIARASE